MTLAAGTRLGAYEILAKLGEGGMGEVYRARDTTLGREVALKILPETLATDAERLARFEREARTLATLNHPRIAQVYGFDDQRALIMELVDGEDLSARIARGPIQLDEALPIARQIAEALEAAHDAGIIHRDLKPANVKVRGDGSVKVLDFGLAKASGTGGARGASGAGGASALLNSPTITSPAALTMGGMILGTAAYMAPEQAKGKPVDRRADIWAFGCVLYEMLTGRAAFAGETVSDVLAQIIEREPAWSALPPTTPPRLRELLRLCLVKDVRQRLRDAGDLRIALEHVADREPPPADVAPSRRRYAVPAVMGSVLLLGTLIGVGWMLAKPPAPGPSLATRLAIDLDIDATLYTPVGPAGVLSPDGTALVFVATPPAQVPQLYFRRLDQLETTPLAGTAGARDAVFSPDGQTIAFFADGKLKRLSLGGGAPTVLADAGNARGSDWLDADHLAYVPDSRSPVMRIAATGGPIEPLSTLADGETSHRWPQVLPGSEAILYTAVKPRAQESTTDSDGGPRIVVERLRDRQREVLVRGAYFARYVASGHLVYMQGSTLFAAPFDLRTLRLQQPGVPVLEQVTSNDGPLSAQVSVSRVGSMVYVPGGNLGGGQMFWVDREGRTTLVGPPTGRFQDARISPDGTRIVLSASAVSNGPTDLWIYDTARQSMNQLTFSAASDQDPIWSPDGQWVAFASAAAPGAVPNVHVRRADGTGETIHLIRSPTAQLAHSWHPSGRFLAISEVTEKGTDILVAEIEITPTSIRASAPTPLVESPSTETEPAFSPDGRWLAYQSNVTGQSFEIYVRPFPGAGGPWRISTAGGSFPTWAPKGGTLYFRNYSLELMAATYEARGEAFVHSPPQVWSKARVTDLGTTIRAFDMHPDGQRALIGSLDPSQASEPRLVYVSNFFDELRQRLSSGAR
jgi:Tol biopolymer transport system component/predicted Ser/Thr protein kinase